MKGESSKWIKDIDKKYYNFYWQRGYGIFSVNPKGIDTVSKYIDNQKEHHQHKSFKDEFRTFLEQYNIEYEEKYVWD